MADILDPDKPVGKTPKTLSGDESPAYTSDLYDEMEPRWKLCRGLAAGTEALRANPKTYIPQHQEEDDDEYVARAGRAEVYPGFSHSVKGLAGIALRKDPILGTDVPAATKQHLENIDGQGNHFGIFSRRLLEDGLTVGHALILIDMPRVSTLPANRRITKEERNRLKLRPYWTHIKAEQVYSWQTEVVDGVTTLVQIVIHEETQIPVGRFQTESRDRYRVFNFNPDNGIVSFELYEVLDDKKPDEVTLKDAGVLTGVNRIPIVVIYCGTRVAPLFSLPALLDLAYTNVSHIQVLADHRHALHISSVPILMFKGRPQSARVDDKGNPKKTVISPNVAIDVDEKGDIKYVEHEGKALGQTRSELKDLETHMAALGLAMLQAETRQAETAEAKRIDKSEKDSKLSVIARALADGLEIALDFHAQWIGEGAGNGGSIEVDLDFDKIPFTSADIDTYSKLVTANQLSLQTMWEILRNRGALPDDFDADQELTDIENLNPNPPPTETEPPEPANPPPGNTPPTTEE